MTPSSTDNPAELLAARITALLREQPLRRAPQSLQGRVMAAIERRRRGWQPGFMRWPLAVRVAFIALSGLTAKLALDVSLFLIDLVGAQVSAPRLPLATALTDAALAVSRNLPMTWVYGGIAMLLLIYSGLFGLGTAAYRTLYLQH